MKTILVVAAVIRATNENGDPIIFATQRIIKTAGNFPAGKSNPEKHRRKHWRVS